MRNLFVVNPFEPQVCVKGAIQINFIFVNIIISAIKTCIEKYKFNV